MIFYEHYAVIPRGTDSLFLKDQFIFIKNLKIIILNFSPKNKYIIYYNYKK